MGESRGLKDVVIGVDLGGFCADYYGRMREIVAEWFGKSPQDLPEDVGFGLWEWGVRDNEEYKRVHRFAFTEKQLFETMRMIPGARTWLGRLSDKGARIRIITNRLYVGYCHRNTINQTVKWLDANGIPYWELCFLKQKTYVSADLYVEDSKEQI
ncbi:MAG: hypothetical protein QHH07_02070 [Sedimentisphaerales bacterium]|nr:hypothetical protein [Sedimentisphaerales bacterium]